MKASLNRRNKKLKPVGHIVKSRKSNILVRPQFSKHPITRRRKEIKKLHPTGAPQEVNATAEVLLGSATAGPFGALIGLGSATSRSLDRIRLSDISGSCAHGNKNAGNNSRNS